jgi:hypothetical protein
MKLMYLASRNPAFTEETFIPRWRQHGALAMAQRGWDDNLFYVHADLVRPVPLAGLSDAYDGVGYVLLTADRLRNPSSARQASHEILLEDEFKAFDGPVLPKALVVEEEFVKDGPRGGVSAFLFCDDVGMADQIGQAFSAQPDPGRVVLNRVLADRPLLEPPLFSYQAVVEVGAADLDTLITTMGTVREGVWQSSDLAVVTRENILWDRLLEHGGTERAASHRRRS